MRRRHRDSRTRSPASTAPRNEKKNSGGIPRGGEVQGCDLHGTLTRTSARRGATGQRVLLLFHGCGSARLRRQVGVQLPVVPYFYFPGLGSLPCASFLFIWRLVTQCCEKLKQSSVRCLFQPSVGRRRKSVAQAMQMLQAAQVAEPIVSKLALQAHYSYGQHCCRDGVAQAREVDSNVMHRRTGRTS